MPVAEARRMLHRRSSATAAVLVLLLGGALSACGFDLATDRVNTIAAGTNNRDANIDALGIRLLAERAGEARLIGALANNTVEEGALVGLSGDGITVEPFEEITVGPRGRLDLAGADVTRVFVSGDFTAGQVVTMEMTVRTDIEETISLDIPVVKLCGQYLRIPDPFGPPAGAEVEDAPTDEATEAPEPEEESVEDPNFICIHPTPSGLVLN